MPTVGDAEAVILVPGHWQRHPGDIDLVVTDVVMPRMGGRELAEWLAVHHPEVRVRFMIGYADPGQEPAATAVAAGHLLQKPFVTSALLHLAAKALARPGG